MTGTTRDGDRPAETREPADFRAFFERSCPGMLARALLLARHRQDAEDAVQEAYAEAWRYWDRVGRYDAPDAWVYKVVRQRLWAARRRWWIKVRPVGLEVPGPATASVEETANARAVLAALDTLSQRRRLMLGLYVWGMSQQEIAADLDITHSAVRVTILHARRNLKKVLGMEPGKGTRRGGSRSADTASDSSDALVPAGRPIRPAALRWESGWALDPLARALRETEAWRREGVEADQQMLARIRAAVFDGTAEEAAQ